MIEDEHARSGGGVDLRLYAALTVAQEPAQQFAALTEGLDRGDAPIRAVAPQDMHLTFAFLGQVAEEYVPVVATSLDAAALTIPGPTACTATGCAAFGGGSVLAATITIELQAMLGAARDAFIDAVHPYAQDVDRRPWHPHVTILRVPRGSSVPDPVAASSTLLADGPVTWIASELQLCASLTAPGGPIQRVLHAVPLGQHAIVRD